MRWGGASQIGCGPATSDSATANLGAHIDAGPERVHPIASGSCVLEHGLQTRFRIAHVWETVDGDTQSFVKIDQFRS